jgi:L-aspartate oxidase
VGGEGPSVVRELVDLGARFTEERPGVLSLGREGGHSFPRVVHADDMTGREVARTLVSAAESLAEIELLDHHMAVDLLVDTSGRCRGAWVLDAPGGRLIEIRAAVTLLATGGCGQVFLHTTNPQVASGDGIAMAWRAGAGVGNMEFMQFHPTMFYDPQRPPFLITEALRGYGAVLVDHQDTSFVEPMATRDIVAHAIVNQMRESGQPNVYLDVTAKDAAETKRRFPNIYRHCLASGIDMTKELVPVVPAAHYLCGGVCTDAQGQTTVPGLYAAGEVAMTGFQGANRLASNSLLEALVFARRVCRDARLEQSNAEIKRGGIEIGPACATEIVAQKREAVRHIMWEAVGIVRSDGSLERACRTVEELEKEIEDLYGQHGAHAELVQLRNLVKVAQLIARSARARHESRGVHFNEDHAQRDDACWQRDTLMMMSSLEKR